jgi:hypothetical protein
MVHRLVDKPDWNPLKDTDAGCCFRPWCHVPGWSRPVRAVFPSLYGCCSPPPIQCFCCCCCCWQPCGWVWFCLASLPAPLCPLRIAHILSGWLAARPGVNLPRSCARLHDSSVGMPIRRVQPQGQEQAQGQTGQEQACRPVISLADPTFSIPSPAGFLLRLFRIPFGAWANLCPLNGL